MLSRVQKVIDGTTCYYYENKEAGLLLIQPVDAHDLAVLDEEVAIIEKLVGESPFSLVAFQLEDWNQQLSPWEAPAVFGNEAFGAGASDTLDFVTNHLIPAFGKVQAYYVGGYSLAGLFALWAAYQTNMFAGAAGVSPSVWFPGWDAHMMEHSMKAEKVYLSLGLKEERTRNQTMAKVGDNIRRQYEILCGDAGVSACTLEWNPGNHFMDSQLRTAKGFAWLLKKS